MFLFLVNFGRLSAWVDTTKHFQGYLSTVKFRTNIVCVLVACDGVCCSVRFPQPRRNVDTYIFWENSPRHENIILTSWLTVLRCISLPMCKRHYLCWIWNLNPTLLISLILKFQICLIKLLNRNAVLLQCRYVCICFLNSQKCKWFVI